MEKAAAEDNFLALRNPGVKVNPACVYLYTEVLLLLLAGFGFVYNLAGAVSFYFFS